MVRVMIEGFGAPLASRPPTATLPGQASHPKKSFALAQCTFWGPRWTNLPEFPSVSSGFHPAQALGGVKGSALNAAPSNSLLCRPLRWPRSGNPLSPIHPQPGDLPPLKRRSTPSRRRSLRSQGQAAAMSEPVLVLWASFAAARGEQLELQARRRWSEGAEVPKHRLHRPQPRACSPRSGQ